jgi:DNA-binding winged helix-turn-helix (wHTH) protein
MKSLLFHFGDFQFDSQRELLLEHALPVPIGRRTLALLRTLLTARGDVVSKATLMDAAWPSLYVEESNLTVQMAALRRRLGRTSSGDEWIVTFPRIGYRFACPSPSRTEMGMLSCPRQRPRGIPAIASGSSDLRALRAGPRPVASVAERQ